MIADYIWKGILSQQGRHNVWSLRLLVGLVGWSHSKSGIREGGGEIACVQLSFSFVCSLGPQPIEWQHSLFG